MTDYFKTIRAYLRGKWGRKNRYEYRWASLKPIDAIKAHELRCRIQSLRRNKKKHSHLQKQLDDLLNGGAQISDQQTETTK